MGIGAQRTAGESALAARERQRKTYTEDVEGNRPENTHQSELRSIRTEQCEREGAHSEEDTEDDSRATQKSELQGNVP